MSGRVLATVLALAIALTACGQDNGGSDDPTTPDGGQPDAGQSEIKLCPDDLEVAGPYRRGIDPEYDPAMDWDGDGVSCE
jgi:hypothetical protein